MISVPRIVLSPESRKNTSRRKWVMLVSLAHGTSVIGSATSIPSGPISMCLIQGCAGPLGCIFIQLEMGCSCSALWAVVGSFRIENPDDSFILFSRNVHGLPKMRTTYLLRLDNAQSVILGMGPDSMDEQPWYGKCCIRQMGKEVNSLPS